jgi:hypothetical protein
LLFFLSFFLSFFHVALFCFVFVFFCIDSLWHIAKQCKIGLRIKVLHVRDRCKNRPIRRIQSRHFLVHTSQTNAATHQQHTTHSYDFRSGLVFSPQQFHLLAQREKCLHRFFSHCGWSLCLFLVRFSHRLSRSVARFLCRDDIIAKPKKKKKNHALFVFFFFAPRVAATDGDCFFFLLL